MMLTLISFALISLRLTAGQSDCFGEGFPAIPQTDRVTKGADNFAIKLFTDIAVSYPFNSIVLSPYSVWSVLNLAYLGSGGSTETELKQALGVPSKSDGFYGGKIIESMLRLHKGTTFNKADKAYFATDMELNTCAVQKLPELEKVDFRNSAAAAQKINQDIRETTNGKISNFLSPGVIANARFVLINAVYFKGLWAFPFVESRTAVRPFYDETRRVNISTATMMSTQAKLKYVNSDLLGAEVLELPYEDSSISMFVILPSTTQSVNAVLSRLNSDILERITKELKIRTTAVSIPRFEMTTRIAKELKTALKNLGVNDIFDASRADLSKFVNNERPFVDEALHHATIEVTEEGTVAAAVTGLIGTRSGASDMVNFVADRPFIFLIRDVSQGITLFIGVLRNPNHTKRLS